MAGKIFVSYRRDDTAPFAISVAQYLENRFGKDRVFLDVDRLRAGEDFPSVLKRKLADCAVVLAIIGPNWLDAMEQRDSIEAPEPVRLAAKDVGANSAIQIGMPKLGGTRRPPYPTAALT